MVQRFWVTCAFVLMLAPSISRAAVTQTFRDGVSPSAAYAGTRDVVVYSQDGLCWDTTQACDTASLIVDANPAQSAVLMRWDLSSIPTTASVNSVTLTLYVEQSSGHAYPIYASLRPWVEGQANWTTYASGQAWQSAGGQGAADRGAAVLGTLNALPMGAQTITLTAAGVSAVQQWVSTPSSNLGMVVIDFTSPDALSWAQLGNEHHHPAPAADGDV